MLCGRGVSGEGSACGVPQECTHCLSSGEAGGGCHENWVVHLALLADGLRPVELTEELACWLHDLASDRRCCCFRFVRLRRSECVMITTEGLEMLADGRSAKPRWCLILRAHSIVGLR